MNHYSEVKSGASLNNGLRVTLSKTELLDKPKKLSPETDSIDVTKASLKTELLSETKVDKKENDRLERRVNQGLKSQEEKKRLRGVNNKERRENKLNDVDKKEVRSTNIINNSNKEIMNESDNRGNEQRDLIEDKLERDEDNNGEIGYEEINRQVESTPTLNKIMEEKSERDEDNNGEIGYEEINRQVENTPTLNKIMEEKEEKPVEEIRIVKHVRKVEQQKREIKENKTDPRHEQWKKRYEAMSDAERADRRAWFRIQFATMKERYGQYQYPTIEEKTPLYVIHAEYQRYVDQITIDQNLKSSVKRYRLFLYIILFCLELFITKVLGLNLGGLGTFTIFHYEMVDDYDRLLIELGEKYSTPGNNNTPIEIKIILAILFNAIVFVVVSKITSFVGPQIGSSIRSMLLGFMKSTQPTPQQQSTGDNGQPPNPPPAQSGGGFDPMKLFGSVMGMFGGGNNNNVAESPNNTDKSNNNAAPRVRRKPAYAE